jgi:protease I
MAGKSLQGKKIAILATDGFEQAELEKPRKALDDAGATTHVIAPDKTQKPGEIKGWDMTDWGSAVKVDKTVGEAVASDYDALLLPGGVMNPDKLRTDKQAVSFVKEFFDSGKPVAAICHGPWTLVEAGVVEGRRMTSWPSIKTDLRNAGANWVDEEVVVDGQLVTSRKPDDIPAFNAKIIEVFAGNQPQRLKQAS